MDNSNPKRNSYLKEPVAFIVIILILSWSILVGFSLYWNISNLRKDNIDLATAEAKANWNKDQAFRGWATKHGGVYVKPNERTPPNPYLAHLPNRDIKTTKDVALTLMNPAYMMSQMTKEYEETYGIKGSITGKVLLNPSNKADDWELKVLDLFESGIKEFVEEKEIDGDPYIRYMKPMIMVEGCVKCHGHLGFKVGDIRGGVSVSIPLKPYIALFEQTSKNMMSTHFLVWTFGCLAIFAYAYTARRRDIERQNLQLKLSNNQNVLAQRVEERTEELKIKEKELLDSQAREHHSNKLSSLGEMASGIAHEINSPLQSITLSTHMLKKDDKLNTEQLERIDRAVFNITNIVESLRKMSRDSSQDDFESVSVSDIIDDVLGLTTERYKIRSIKLNIAYVNNCQAVKLVCQRLQIGQVLVNLLNNSYDAIEQLDEKWIDITIKDLQNEMQITITDSGKGIDIIKRDKIFEPMFTTKDIGKGTGLGLSISSEIIKKHSGTLTLDPNCQNTSFVLSLPKNIS